jgi:hypothetical protein
MDEWSEMKKGGTYQYWAKRVQTVTQKHGSDVAT